ncbi:MAG: hypothetical protein K6E74_02055 [Bacilli bacterium]|nr:hypothetical protein [Bacilli bacterium]
MPNPKGKSVYHLVIDTEEYKKFNRLYPQLLKIFLNRAVKMANDDYELFTKIFFENKEK